MADNKNELLDSLHSVLIKTLLEKINSREATASDMSVARQLLKDNGIDCTTTAKPQLSQLAKQVLPQFTDDISELLCN